MFMYHEKEAEYKPEPKHREKEGECCTINVICKKEKPFEKYSFYDKFKCEAKEPHYEEPKCYEDDYAPVEKPRCKCLERKPCWVEKEKEEPKHEPEKSCVVINILCDGKCKKNID